MTSSIETAANLTAAGVPHGFTGTLPEADRPAALAALGLADRRLVTARQVHGAAVLDADRDEPGGEADAVVATDPAVAVAVYTADCVPVLLASADGQRVAAVHAGWRGLLAGVIEAAVARFDAPPLAAVGPCVGVARYEVSREIADRFGEPTRHVDLRRAAAARLAAAGAGDVWVSDTCTFESAAHPSYRRDGVARPSMLSIVAVR